MAPLNPHAAPWTPPGYHAAATALPPDALPPFDLQELPMEILSAVMSRMACAEDLCSCLQASRQLAAAVGAAHTSLALTAKQRHGLNNAADAGLTTDKLVSAIVSRMPGMVSCNLAALPLEQPHVARLLAGLPRLAVLDLSSNRKLTAAVTRILQQPADQRSLRCLNLQRCFQLHQGCLSDLLLWSVDGSSGLACICMSHLDLTAWPPSGPATAAAAAAATGGATPAAAAAASEDATWRQLQEAAQDALARAVSRPQPCLAPASARGGGLRVLALNNCSNLELGGLMVLAAACPQLQYLMLGGCTLKSAVRLAPAAAAPAAALAAAGADAAANGSSGAPAGALPPALQQLDELLQLPEVPPWPLLGRCCSGHQACGCSCQCSCCCRAAPSSRRNEPSAAALAAARVEALGLAAVALALPRLKALEVTFLAPGVAGLLRLMLESVSNSRCSSSSSSSSKGSGGSGDAHQQQQQPARVWDFTCTQAVREALQELEQSKRQQGVARCGSSGCAELAMALGCAVNCSSRGRSTPLHLAADRGCACVVRALLAAGAAACRDASGATPLMVAAEAGQADAAEALVVGGADLLLGNTAGETPLYISALRGHLPVVQLLLRQLAAAGVDWTSSRLYGDAWTPLMAAAVANRLDVALCLLRAARQQQQQQQRRRQQPAGAMAGCVPGGGGGGRWPAAGGRFAGCCGREAAGVAALLAAENRYGQTALHIAARRGDRQLLAALVSHGAGRLAMAVDASGETPLDVARRHGHESLLVELCSRTAVQV